MSATDARHDASVTYESGDYTVRVSDSPDDPAWDDFLERSPMGHFAQTSGWGRARMFIGWRTVRVVVSRGQEVLGGAQLVSRPMPAAGNVGFVCRGPVVDRNEPGLVKLVFAEMMAMSKAEAVGYLVVQPPPGCDWMLDELKALGFRYGAFDIDFTSTVRIDLEPDLDDILAAMTKKRRQHIRSAARRGEISVRRGGEADVAIFNRLKDTASDRLGYERRSGDYYAELWRAMSPRGHIEVFIAEVDGEPVSAQLAIPFGDTCRHMERPWSGQRADLRPNEFVEWETIRWAKEQGYRYTDLQGIDMPLAEAVLSGRELPKDPVFSASLFKLEFGGRVIVDPPSYDYVFSPLLRFGYRCIPVRVMRSERMRKFLFRFRETGS